MNKVNALKGNWLVTRTIRLQDMANWSDIQTIEAILKPLNGIHTLTTDIDNEGISVTYDASCLDYLTIIQTLKQANIPIKNTWWTHLKGSWYQYTDSNARDNAHAPAAPCCNKPPRQL